MLQDLMDTQYELNPAGCCVWSTSHLYARAANCKLIVEGMASPSAKAKSADMSRDEESTEESVEGIKRRLAAAYEGTVISVESPNIQFPVESRARLRMRAMSIVKILQRHQFFFLTFLTDSRDD